MPRISVVVPNWNGEKLLAVSLPSIDQQTFTDFEVIVVDNGSKDNTVSYIKASFPHFRVIELPKNFGFAKAVNVGIKNSQGQYVVLINNDTKIDKDCLKFLFEAAEEHLEVGFVAAKMLNFFQPRNIDGAGDWIDSVGHASSIGLGEEDGPKFNKAGYVFLTSGGGSLFKKEVFEKVGLFDEDYFAYFEDVDLCFRAQLLGFKGWYEPRAVIYHVHKATSLKNRPFLEYLQFRNMTMNILKNFPKGLFLADWNWFKIILVNLNTVRFLSFKGYLLSAIKAEIFILVNCLKIFQKRQQIQAARTVLDSYILENVLPKKISLFKLLKKGF